MSLVRMRQTMQGKLHLIMLGLAIVFAVGWIGICLSSGGSGGGGNEQSGLVARVNKEKLERMAFEQLAEKTKTRVEQNGRMISAFEESQLRGSVLDEMIGGVLRHEAAKQLRVKVTRGDTNAAIKQYVDAQIAQLRSRLTGGRTGSVSDTALDAMLRKQGLSLSKVESDVRASIDMDSLREQLLMDKILKKLQQGMNTSDQAIRASYEEVRFRQITIGGQARPMPQAEMRAKEISDKLKKGENFVLFAGQYSEDAYKTSGGDRGMFVRRAYLEKALADVVFSLKPGEISGPIKQPMGYVIVKVEQKRSALPADFNDPKKRKEYKDSYIAQEQYMAQSRFFSDIQKNAKVVVYDPELKAYMAAKELSGLVGVNPAQAKAKAKEALKELQTALSQSASDPQASARINSQIGYIYDWLRKPDLFQPTKEERIKYRDQAKQALENALQFTESNDLRTMLADIAIEEGQYDKAMEHLDMVSQNAYDDPNSHKELLLRYEKLKAHAPQKMASLIVEEKKWAADYDKQMKAQQEQQGGAISKPFRVNPGGKVTTEAKPGG